MPVEEKLISNGNGIGIYLPHSRLEIHHEFLDFRVGAILTKQIQDSSEYRSINLFPLTGHEDGDDRNLLKRRRLKRTKVQSPVPTYSYLLV